MKNLYYFFWNGNASQWKPSKFKFLGLEFNCAEQFMMAGKAKLFNDEKRFKKIMESGNPRDQKAHGRKIKNFDNELWMEYATDIVTVGNVMKFYQNPELYKWLFRIKENHQFMVEASPYDTIWGIGLNDWDERCADKETWLGLNLLGESIDNAYAFIQLHEERISVADIRFHIDLFNGLNVLDLFSND